MSACWRAHRKGNIASNAVGNAVDGMLGPLVGTNVSPSSVGLRDDGEVIGKAVGTFVDGRRVGTAVGPKVSPASVGLRLGGELVGPAVGASVGTTMGPRAGCNDGLIDVISAVGANGSAVVGIIVGIMDGDTVRFGVGAAVGVPLVACRRVWLKLSDPAGS